jgi:hypothetical protein
LAGAERRIAEATGEDLGGGGHDPTVAANRCKAASAEWLMSSERSSLWPMTCAAAAAAPYS